jgi:hypothetical protein
VFTDTWYQGKPASLQIIVTDNDTEYTPYVAGWFDWNQDGQFQSTELIKFGNLEAGTHNRTIDVPSTSSLGRIYMRFRIYATQSPPDVLSPTGAVTNGEVEDYWQTNNEPTAVDLVSFSAAPEGGAVRLTWETATEIDNLGFHLYRSTSPSGPWSRLNNSLIPTQNPGASFGAIYSWLDEDVEPNVTYYYRLEDVDASGKVTSHGPVEATLDGDPTAVRLARFSAPRDAGFSLAFLGLAALLVALRNRRRR